MSGDDNPDADDAPKATVPVLGARTIGDFTPLVDQHVMAHFHGAMKLTSQDARRAADAYNGAVEGLRQMNVSMRAATAAAVVIGRNLTIIKGLLGHGKWMPWVEKALPVTVQTATKYMRAAEAADKLSESFNLEDVSTSVLLMLGAPDADPKLIEAVAERSKAGERITTRVVKDETTRVAPKPAKPAWIRTRMRELAQKVEKDPAILDMLVNKGIHDRDDERAFRARLEEHGARNERLKSVGGAPPASPKPKPVAPPARPKNRTATIAFLSARQGWTDAQMNDRIAAEAELREIDRDGIIADELIERADAEGWDGARLRTELGAVFGPAPTQPPEPVEASTEPAPAQTNETATEPDFDDSSTATETIVDAIKTSPIVMRQVTTRINAERRQIAKDMATPAHLDALEEFAECLAELREAVAEEVARKRRESGPLSEVEPAGRA